MAQQLVRLDQRSAVIAELLKANKGHMIAAAPRGMGDPLRLLNVAANMIMYDAKLLQCTQESIIGCIFESLKLGIAVGGPGGEGWIIPFGSTATLIVGFQGYRNIIDRAGAVIDMHPRAVHNGRKKAGNEWVEGTPDQFDFYFGDNPRIIHRPLNPSPLSKDQLRAVYCVANLRRGGKQMEVLELEEVEAHRLRSRAKDSGPWQTDYVAMALKTAVRKIAKYLPKSNELLSRAVDLDERADRGVDQGYEIPAGTVFLDDATGGPKNVTPAAKSPLDRLKQSHGIPPKDPTADAEAEARQTDEEQRTDHATPPAAEDIKW